MYVLNLNRSPENGKFWVWADPVLQGAGHAGGARKASANCPPGVSASIELHNGMQITRRATSELLGKWPQWPPSMAANATRGVQMVASQVMEIGTPQRLATKRGNARRAKISTDGRPRKRKHDHYARSE